MAPNLKTAAARLSSWPVRVYYEDTDAAGVVYYANYLRFCERGRTEMLRALGVDQRKLRADQGIVFVVARIEADYLRGAELDDALQVISSLHTIGAATVLFDQQVLRGEECLFRTKVTIACVDWVRRRPARIPDFLRTLFESQA